MNTRPLLALEQNTLGLIISSRVDTAGDNQKHHVIIADYDMGFWISSALSLGTIISPRPLARELIRVED